MSDLDLSDQPGFLAKLDNAKVLEQLLKVLQFKDTVQIVATSKGLKITAEVSKSFFGSAFVQRETFSEYQLNRPTQENNQNNQQNNEDDFELDFTISLFTLNQCLNLTGATSSGGGKDDKGNTMAAASTLSSLTSFAGSCRGINPSILLHYPEDGQPLTLLVEEAGGVVTKATIPTLDRDLHGDFVDFTDMMEQNNTQITARIILMADHLCNILSEFDSKSDTLEIGACPEAKTVTFSTSSTIVSKYSVEVPYDSEIINGWRVDRAVSSKYQFSMLKHALKPMSMAEKVSIRFDSRNFLSVQYMIKVSGDTTCFMEFYCAPEVDDSDQNTG